MPREKHRWILFEIIHKNESIDKDTLIKLLRKKTYELYGSLCAPKFRVVEYDEKKAKGIICCPRDGLNKLRVILAFIREGPKKMPIFINDLYCSGSLRKLKEKRANIKAFSEKYGESR